MDSFSKIPLSVDIAESIVTAQFGSQRRLVQFQELKEGFFNAAALLVLDDGLKCVLKAAPPAEIKVLRYEKDLMRAEVESMRLVRAQTNVPVPAIYAYDTSRSILPSEYFLMEALHGAPFHKLYDRLTADQRDQI